MTRTFIHAFHDELVKQATHPILSAIAGGGTMLGQKVRGAISRTAKKSRKIGSRAIRGAGLKGVVEKKAGVKHAFIDGEDSDEGGDTDADQAGEFLRQMMAQYQQDQGYQDEPDPDANAPMYGSGPGPQPSKTKQVPMDTGGKAGPATPGRFTRSGPPPTARSGPPGAPNRPMPPRRIPPPGTPGGPGTSGGMVPQGPNPKSAPPRLLPDDLD